MALTEYLAGEVAEDFADGLLSRREALRRLLLLGVSVTAAGGLLAACGGDDDGDPAATPSTADEGATTTTTNTTSTDTAETVRFAGKSGELIAAWAAAHDPKRRCLWFTKIRV